jgi:hypothetical protein
MADSPNTTTAPKIPGRDTAREIVFHIEDDVRAVREYAKAITLIGFGMGGDGEGAAVQRLGRDLEDVGERLGKAYRRLHIALHETKQSKPTPMPADDDEDEEEDDEITASWSPAFRAVADMEDPLTAIQAYAIALSRMSDSLSDKQEELAFDQVSRQILHEVEVVEDLRAKAFHELHPNRQRQSGVDAETEGADASALIRLASPPESPGLGRSFLLRIARDFMKKARTVGIDPGLLIIRVERGLDPLAGYQQQRPYIVRIAAP